MKMIILSELVAKSYINKLDSKTQMISITCKYEDDVVFNRNSNLKNIFRMKFNDLEKDVDDMKAPILNDFKGLKNYIDNLDCDLLIVHCGAGVSRSAGVAAAINDYLDLGYDIFNDKRYMPNRLVYNLVLEELGIAKNKDYYEDIFNDR